MKRYTLEVGTKDYPALASYPNTRFAYARRLRREYRQYGYTTTIK